MHCRQIRSLGLRTSTSCGTDGWTAWCYKFWIGSLAIQRNKRMVMFAYFHKKIDGSWILSNFRPQQVDILWLTHGPNVVFVLQDRYYMHDFLWENLERCHYSRPTATALLLIRLGQSWWAMWQGLIIIIIIYSNFSGVFRKTIKWSTHWKSHRNLLCQLHPAVKAYTYPALCHPSGSGRLWCHVLCADRLRWNGRAINTGYKIQRM